LRSPVLVISDGAPGRLSAVEQVFLSSLRQRWLVHRARNLLAKVPTGAQAEVKAAFWQIFDDLDQPPGQAAVHEATRRAEAFADRDRRRYPAAVACLTSTLAELTTHLRFPREHWRRIRHSNFIEPTFRGDPSADQGDRPAARRDELPVAGVGGPGPRLTGLARREPDPLGSGWCRICAASSPTRRPSGR
jgi:Transposase, Mutator family